MGRAQELHTFNMRTQGHLQQMAAPVIVWSLHCGGGRWYCREELLPARCYCQCKAGAVSSMQQQCCNCCNCSGCKLVAAL